MNVPGLPQLSTDKTAWTPVQRRDLLLLWQELGRVIGVNATHIQGLPVYANNAAAVAAGLNPGSLYRTGGDPDLVAVVH